MSAPIKIDYREPDEFAKKFSTGLAGFAELPFGDFAFKGNGPEGIVRVGIERKTVRDFLGSMSSGRLASHQLPGLLDRYPGHAYLILEGTYSEDASGLVTQPHGWRKGQWHTVRNGTVRYLRSALESFAQSIRQTWDVQLWRTDSLDDTAATVEYWYNWYQKPWVSHKSQLGLRRDSKAKLANAGRKRGSIHGFRNRHAKRIPHCVQYAYTLNGVGEETAWKLHERFSTVEDFVLATVDEIAEVEGIGVQKARTLYRQMREP